MYIIHPTSANSMTFKSQKFSSILLVSINILCLFTYSVLFYKTKSRQIIVWCMASAGQIFWHPVIPWSHWYWIRIITWLWRYVVQSTSCSHLLSLFSPTHPTPMTSPVLLCPAQSIAHPQHSWCYTTPMKGFVHKVLHCLQTSRTVLQTALCYLKVICPHWILSEHHPNSLDQFCIDFANAAVSAYDWLCHFGSMMTNPFLCPVRGSLLYNDFKHQYRHQGIVASEHCVHVWCHNWWKFDCSSSCIALQTSTHLWSSQPMNLFCHLLCSWYVKLPTLGFDARYGQMMLV